MEQYKKVLLINSKHTRRPIAQHLAISLASKIDWIFGTVNDKRQKEMNGKIKRVKKARERERVRAKLSFTFTFAFAFKSWKSLSNILTQQKWIVKMNVCCCCCDWISRIDTWRWQSNVCYWFRCLWCVSVSLAAFFHHLHQFRAFFLAATLVHSISIDWNVFSCVRSLAHTDTCSTHTF